MTYTETVAAVKADGCADSDLVLQAIIAIRKTLPCLSDWIRSTGYGMANARDTAALVECMKFLDMHSRQCAHWGVQVAPSEESEAARYILKGKGVVYP